MEWVELTQLYDQIKQEVTTDSDWFSQQSLRVDQTTKELSDHLRHGVGVRDQL